MFAQMNLAADSSKSPQRLIMYLVAEATCYCQARNLFLPQNKTHPMMDVSLLVSTQSCTIRVAEQAECVAK